jgi:hypothetical protein
MPASDDPGLAQLNRELTELKRERTRFDTMELRGLGTYSSSSRKQALRVSDELIAAKKAEIEQRLAELGIS